MSTFNLDLTGVAVVDNHAHALTRRQPEDGVSFREHFTEAHSPLLARDHVGTAAHYRWALRQLGRVLDVPPLERAILEHRHRLGLVPYTRLLMREANLMAVLLDEGYPPADLAYSSDEMAEMLGVRVARIVRLETVVQTLISAHPHFAEVVSAFDAALEAAVADGYVALKSIAAYRTGLRIAPVTDDEAEQAFGPARIESMLPTRFRLASKHLIDFFVLRALRFAAERSVPVQFHTGYGDPDLDLRLANPLHLRPLFEEPSLSGAPIVLLHESYPFTAEAAFLAASYPNAYLDLAFSLPPLDHGELMRVTRTALGVAPASKLMCSSDGTRIPEHYWLGAVRARQCIGSVLEAMVAADDLDEHDAVELATMILRDNALRVYGL